MVKIAILGYGTVGSGVVKVISENQALIDKKAGEEIRVKYVLDLRDFPGDPVQDILVHDYETILNDPEVKVVVETMGGLNPAYDFTKAALLKGKSVCTSNKELVAAHGSEFLSIAREKQVNYLFEASCGGGIPIIRPLISSFTADEIDEVSGILNGTTNFILTEMAEKGSDFQDVLKEAQQLGYAEKNPEADVEGYDACRKIAILSSLAFGHTVHYEDIETEGITHISPEDIAFAKELNASVKLLASAYWEEVEGKRNYYAMVAPFLVAKGHPLCQVNGVFNAVFVHGNMVGDTLFYGSGAGSLPTASAVVGDVVDVVKHLGKTIYICWDPDRLSLESNKNAKRAFFVRVSSDKLKEAETHFRASKTLYLKSLPHEAGLVTAVMPEGEFMELVEKFGGVESYIRINH